MNRLPLALTLAVAIATGAADESFSAAARGFGQVEAAATFAGAPGARSAHTVFRCQDPAHAVVVASKRLADLVAFGDIAPAGAGDLPGTALAAEGAGCWLLALRGAEFHELFAPDRAGLAALAATLPAGCTVVPERAYPRWLDCFDNAGLGVWVGGGGEDYDLPADFAWLHERKLAMCTLAPTESRLVAPGTIDTSIQEWHAAMAERWDLPYRSLLFPARPAWLWNQEPLPHVRTEPGRISNPFLEYEAATIAESYEPIPATDRYLDDLRRRLAARGTADPRLLGWQGCTETSYAGILELAAVAGMPSIKELWHQYLRRECGFDLAALAREHYAGRAAPAGWDQVEAPLPRDFLGWDPATCIDLAGEWEVRADPQNLGPDADAPWTRASCQDVLIGMYGTRYNHDKATTAFWMRRVFTVPADGLTAQRWLHIARCKHHDKFPEPFAVRLNGKPVERLGKDAYSDWDQCYDLGPALRAGDNQLVVDTHGQPIPGHVFTSAVPFRTYPAFGEPVNRRWYDAVNFSAWLRIRAIAERLRSQRAGDPDRPLKMMSLGNLLDLAQPLCDTYGAYHHDTGGAGGYWCPMSGARLVRSHGQPWSCEQGSPPSDAAGTRKMATFYLMYGNDALDMVFGVGAYRRQPGVAAWIDGNIDLMRCIGRMTLPLPPVAILRSTRNTRLGFEQPWNWDIGRGPLQAVGRNFAYLETPDLADGTVAQAKVLFDDGTVLMTEADVDGLERYVRGGGVFVAQHHTGRHAPGQADAWPIARLTGLRAVASGPALGRDLRFADGEELWPRLRGRSIGGHGQIRDFRGRDTTGDPVGFELASPDTAAVAEWTAPQPGQGRVAVAVRHLGKGMVITLGSTFWRDARDAGGAYREAAGAQDVLDELLTSLGVARDSWTGRSEVWAELWRSKNGVFDLYPVARMDERGPESDVAAVTVALRRASAPTRVVDIGAAGHPVIAATWADGRLTLPEASYCPMQARVYAAPRADRERAALDWFRAQAGIWHALPPLPAAERPAEIPAPSTVMPLVDGWRLAPAGDGWLAADPAAWRGVRLGAFATMGLPEDAVGRFRCDIAIPGAWRGARIRLVFDCERYGWGLLPQARLWLDGEPAQLKQPIMPAEQQGFSLDVTGLAASGTLHLALEVDGSARPAAGDRRKPAGVTGMFYLQAIPSPRRSEPLPGPWAAAVDFNVLQPVPAGGSARYVYLQTSFDLPELRPAPRVFLAADGPLGCLVLDGQLVDCPPDMSRLDITGLARTGANQLRWAPAVPYSERVREGAPPALRLEWLDADPR